MLARSSLTPWLRRPAVVVVLCALALAALLSGGLLAARAVDGVPAADSTAAAPTGGTGNGDNNVAGAVNTKDGKTVYAIRIKLVQTSADTVDATNVAAAVASCSDCTTVAIAFEGILVTGSPSTFDPTNLALAYNVNCTGCTTVAEAYQEVVQSSTRVRITGAGRREIAAIRRELDALKKQDLTYDEIAARVEALEDRFAAVLHNDVVPVGHDHTRPSADAVDVSDAGPAAGATTAPASSASPDASGSADPVATSTPSDGASPTDSPSETPTSSPTADPAQSASPEPAASASP